MRSFLFVLIGICSYLLDLGSAHAGYQVISSETSLDAHRGLIRVDAVIQDGDNPINRFRYHRILRMDDRGKPRPTKGPIVLLPDRNASFTLYGIGGEGRSLRDQLALAGYDVYGISPRESLLISDPTVEQCSAIKDWGIDAHAKDAMFVSAIATYETNQKPLIGGFGFGGELATLIVSRHPDSYAGLILWESGLIRNLSCGDAWNCPLGSMQLQCGTASLRLSHGECVDSSITAYFRKTILLGTTFPKG